MFGHLVNGSSKDTSMLFKKVVVTAEIQTPLDVVEIKKILEKNSRGLFRYYRWFSKSKDGLRVLSGRRTDLFSQITVYRRFENRDELKFVRIEAIASNLKTWSFFILLAVSFLSILIFLTQGMALQFIIWLPILIIYGITFSVAKSRTNRKSEKELKRLARLINGTVSSWEIHIK